MAGNDWLEWRLTQSGSGSGSSEFPPRVAHREQAGMNEWSRACVWNEVVLLEKWLGHWCLIGTSLDEDATAWHGHGMGNDVELVLSGFLGNVYW